MIVWLSSYPRSGNTFARALVKTCLGGSTYSIYNDRECETDPGLAEVTGHCKLEFDIKSDKFDLTSLRDSENVFFLKSHEITRALVKEQDKVIYIVRDGRNAINSYRRYLANFQNRQVTFLELILGLEFPGGSWADHLDGWAPDKNKDTLLLNFEQLVSNPRDAIDLISAFSGVPVIGYQIPKFSDLKQINSLFFHSGQKEGEWEEVSEVENDLFWLGSYQQMLKYGYRDHIPPVLTRTNDDDYTVIHKSYEKIISFFRLREHELRTNVQTLSYDNQRLTEHIKNNKLITDELRKTITKMRGSWSWQATRPIRKVASLLRKN